MRVVITGGAGFIGTHLSRRLVGEGNEVVVLDSFSPQIHGANQDLATDLQGHVRLVRGDVRDRDALRDALVAADAVVHLAAETGTGQSMYQIARYSDVNIQGTATLMDLLVNDRDLEIQKVVVASSRAIYGEGKYQCPVHGVVYPKMRRSEAMLKGQFEPECPICSEACSSIPTTEDSPASPSSFYGLSKQVQEQMVLLMARAVNIDAVALRYQNVFGEGQSLNNPYTGILAIFSNLARAGETIRIFEDGNESRDFVHVSDVVMATCLALDPGIRGTHSINVGSGIAIPVLTVAREIIAYFDSASQCVVTGEYRIGDIRHNRADMEAAHRVLGYKPMVSFSDGLKRFLVWASNENGMDGEGYLKSLMELKARGLMGG
jgi:dTDP-L-rhamnose 4-epimerase